MRPIFALLSALLLSPPVALYGADGPMPVPETCTELYRAAVERAMKEPATRRPAAGVDINQALSAWMLGAKTGEARYREFAVERYDRFLPQELDHDFHVSRPFGLLTWRLHRAGLLTGTRREAAQRQARERVAWFLDQRKNEDELFDCNIALADTLAVACLARVFADDPSMRAVQIQRTVTDLGRRIRETGDLNENASNYASLGICFFLELATLEGWLDDVRRSEHFRNMFTRMRDLISPAGSIPEYGDGYFQHRQLRLDFVLLLEMAARLYDDASFQDAAGRLLAAGPFKPDDDQLPRAFMLLELEPFTTTNRTAPVLSAVQYRRVPGEPVKTAPDKLILRTGSQPGDAMIMVDLYAEGSHAHAYKRPSIGFYEAAGVPLFHNLGRRGTRSGQCGNSFWLLDQPDPFPGYPRTNAWNTMTVPAGYCFPADEPGTVRVGDALLFRNFRAPGLKFLRFDNLRLEGPRGSRLLDGFESPKSWHGNVSRHPKVKLESSVDRTQGAFSQQVNWSIFGEQYCTRNLEEKVVRNTTFRLADYDTVKLDYRYDGQHPHCNLRALFKQWIDLGDRPLHCAVVQAAARQLDGDAWGRVDFADYIQPGNTLRRHIVLTREGALVIVDLFTAGPHAGGSAAGQLWQLYSLKERGPDWFAAASDGAYGAAGGATAERRMLVKFMNAPGVRIDAERVHPAAMHAPKADGTQHREFFTTYSRHILAAGSTSVAVLVVLPLANESDAAQRAAGISFEDRKEQGLRVTIASMAGVPPTTVTIRDDTAAIHRLTAP